MIFAFTLPQQDQQQMLTVVVLSTWYNNFPVSCFLFCIVRKAANTIQLTLSQLSFKVMMFLLIKDTCIWWQLVKGKIRRREEQSRMLHSVHRRVPKPYQLHDCFYHKCPLVWVNVPFCALNPTGNL